ncbi:DUF1206 domain-containing protein [Sorangium cellulosum]|uniref:DUF1206 domain-containing protein n=1 Tax=Sorangium cellulosum TaxID=56 RepID=UPI0013317178|nr:DUF1206 domain-containing protein [Sorangium cellulosum]
MRTLARVGFAAKGLVYVLIGALSLQTAIRGSGETAGGREAVGVIGDQPFGQVLLFVVGIGLLGYALWREVLAIKDPGHVGRDAKGTAERVGWAISGVVSAGLALTAFQLALGHDSGRGGGTATWVGTLMEQPFGGVLVGLAGVAVIGVAVAQIRKSMKCRFARDLDTARMSPTERTWVFRMARGGLISRGVVFGIIGSALIKAAIAHDPGQSKDLNDALATVAASPFGTVLLVLVAAGLCAYGVYMFFCTRYSKLSHPAA